MESVLSPDEEAAFVTAEFEQFILQKEPEAEPLHPLAEERLLQQSKLAITTERVVEVEGRYARIVAELVALNAGPTIRVARIERLKNRKSRVEKTLRTVRENYLAAIAETTGLNHAIGEAKFATHALVRALQPPEPYEQYADDIEAEPLIATDLIEAA